MLSFTCHLLSWGKKNYYDNENRFLLSFEEDDPIVLCYQGIKSVWFGEKSPFPDIYPKQKKKKMGHVEFVQRLTNKTIINW